MFRHVVRKGRGFAPGPFAIVPRQFRAKSPRNVGGNGGPKRGSHPKGRIATNWFVAPLSGASPPANSVGRNESAKPVGGTPRRRVALIAASVMAFSVLGSQAAFAQSGGVGTPGGTTTTTPAPTGAMV